MTRLKKIKLNMIQTEAAKISALSTNELDKYDYLTGENLGCKPGVVEIAKFKYSPLGKVFIKDQRKKTKKEELLKRPKNVEDISKEQFQKQLKPIENDMDIANKKALKIKVFRQVKS